MGSIVRVPQEATGPNSRTAMGEGAVDSQEPNIEGWLLAAAQRGSLKTKITTSIE
jgi:hypothetical protein